MVLCYLRLDSDSTDYLFVQCDLDSIVRQAVRRFSAQFIHRKIRLEYEPLDCQVLTDEKWLLFVIEQILSNALKYTSSDEVRPPQAYIAGCPDGYTLSDVNPPA